MVEVKVKKLLPQATIPEYATDGSACFDLRCITDGPVVSLIDRTYAVLNTGLAFEVPAQHVMLIFSRSGMGFNDGVRLANCVGVIDSDYRGEVKVKLTKDELGATHVNNGDRIAQAMIVELPKIRLLEVEELSETDRGEGGYGSTGKA